MLCDYNWKCTSQFFAKKCSATTYSLEIDKEKVLRIIRALRLKKAHCCDDISISMIKMCDTSIVEPLCLIFEKCLEIGVYLSIWKKDNVIPVHKKNSRQSKENYRPISLLPIFGKIFVKLIFDSMYEHFCNINYWQLLITSIVLLKKIQARKLGQYFSTCQRPSTGFSMKV